MELLTAPTAGCRGTLSWSHSDAAVGVSEPPPEARASDPSAPLAIVCSSSASGQGSGSGGILRECSAALHRGIAERPSNLLAGASMCCGVANASACGRCRVADAST
eukprot:1986434-Prymnesium_polylepis.1